MSDCEPYRRKLADVLAGALEPAARDACFAHVESCPSCGEALGELERLEEGLFALGGGARETGGAGIGLALLAILGAAAVAFGVYGLLRASRVEPRVLSGELTVAHRPVAGARFPVGVALTASTRAAIELAGAVVDASRGARLAVLGPRELRLERGEIAVRVAQGPFTIQTPQGWAECFAGDPSAGAQVAKRPSEDARSPHKEASEASDRCGELAVLVQETQTGGLVMPISKNAAITASATVTVLVASGLVLFRTVDGAPDVRLGAGDQAVVRSGSVEITRPSQLAQVAAVHSAEVGKLESENARLRAELARVQEKTAELEKKVADQAPAKAPDATTKTSPDASSPDAKPDARSRGPRLDMPGVRGNADLQKLDWREAGEASRKLIPLVKSLFDKQAKGEQLSSEELTELTTENQKLVKVALAVKGKVPTLDHTTANSEYSHPAVLANIEAAHLDAAGLSLSDDQVAQINALGEDYDRQLQALTARDLDALALEKSLDELELKKTFCDRMDAVLSPDQRGALFDPSTRHLLQLDLYSPMLQVIVSCKPVAKTSAADLKRAISSTWLADLEIDDAHKPDCDTAAAALVGALPLSPMTAAVARFPRIDDALAAGRANVAAIKSLLAGALGSDVEAKSALQKTTLFYVPRLVAKDAGAPR